MNEHARINGIREIAHGVVLDAETAYSIGFTEKCAEFGVDPKMLVKTAWRMPSLKSVAGLFGRFRGKGRPSAPVKPTLPQVGNAGWTNFDFSHPGNGITWGSKPRPYSYRPIHPKPTPTPKPAPVPEAPAPMPKPTPTPKPAPVPEAPAPMPKPTPTPKPAPVPEAPAPMPSAPSPKPKRSWVRTSLNWIPAGVGLGGGYLLGFSNGSQPDKVPGYSSGDANTTDPYMQSLINQDYSDSPIPLSAGDSPVSTLAPAARPAAYPASAQVVPQSPSTPIPRHGIPRGASWAGGKPISAYESRRLGYPAELFQ